MATNTDLAPTTTDRSSPLAQLGPVLPSTDAMARLEEWVVAASRANALITPLVGSAFVPDAYKPKVGQNAPDEEKQAAWDTARANATAAVLLGLSIGLDPLTALQQIYLVKGRPGMYSKMKVALLQSRGFKIWTDELTDDVAVVSGIRPGDEVRTVTVDMAMARKAGWTSNEAYAKTPQDMLWARAAGRWCDRYGGDHLHGIATVEDIPDVVQVEARVGAPLRVTAADVLGTEAEDPQIPNHQPPTVDNAVEGPGPERPVIDIGNAPAAITTAQSKKMYGLLRDKGKDDKDLALVYIAGVIGHEVGSTKDLTVEEASQVIDALDKLDPAPAKTDGEATT